jgi:hypothetical protein
LSTKGDDVANLLRNRIKIGVSSRGVGSLKEGRNGEQIVQDDFDYLLGCRNSAINTRCLDI